jgi:hypothetical protein
MMPLGFQTDIALLHLGGSQLEDRGNHLGVRSLHNPSYRWRNFLLVSHVLVADQSVSWLDRYAAAFPDASHMALGFDAIQG